ncbi:MAG: TetR/AcrR family transcriptional regulator [Porticoccaceae bacterium]|nr:TetR/AcrR family transcriptional regulator [Porticoccaceae bacterium]
MQAKHLPAKERRAHTVEAVIELAATCNPGEITTSAIAKRMNLTQGALFRHFPSKDAIWEAVMAWVAERLLDRLARAAVGSSGALASLEAMFMTHVAFVMERPGVPRMIFGELQRREQTGAKRMVQKLLQTYGKRLVELIEKGKTRGEIAAEVDTAAAATLFIGTIQGLVMQSLLAGDVSRLDRDAHGAFALYRRAIGVVS